MKIKFSPQGGSAHTLTSLEKQGSTLIINGNALDFSGVGEGDTLPRGAVDNPFIVGEVERIDGVLHITVLLPHGPMPQPKSVLFPKPIDATKDGEIKLP